MDKIPIANLIYNHGNPYQKLIYSSPSSLVDLVKAPKSWIGRMSRLSDEERPRALHLHWDDRIFGRQSDRAANMKAADSILADLVSYQVMGGRLIWTVHNRLAHASKDADTLHQARLKLASIADLIHVHSAYAAKYVMDNFHALPERIVIVRHPSYLGAYETKAATLERHLMPGPRAFLHFGYIRSNKGADIVAGTASALSKRAVPPWTLNVVGKAFRGGMRLFRGVDVKQNISVRLEAVPNEEIPDIFGKAHFYLAPFRDLFTSGSVMLAQTYGLPILGPNIEALRQVTPRANHDLLYPDDSNPRRLLQAMTRAIQTDDEELTTRRANCFAYAEETSPEKMSAILGAAIGRIVEA